MICFHVNWFWRRVNYHSFGKVVPSQRKMVSIVSCFEIYIYILCRYFTNGRQCQLQEKTALNCFFQWLHHFLSCSANLMPSPMNTLPVIHLNIDELFSFSLLNFPSLPAASATTTFTIVPLKLYSKKSFVRKLSKKLPLNFLLIIIVW